MCKEKRLEWFFLKLPVTEKIELLLFASTVGLQKIVFYVFLLLIAHSLNQPNPFPTLISLTFAYFSSKDRISRAYWLGGAISNEPYIMLHTYNLTTIAGPWYFW